MSRIDAPSAKLTGHADSPERPALSGPVKVAAALFCAGAIAALLLVSGMTDQVVLGSLSLLAIVGVFALFSTAAGFLRFADKASSDEFYRLAVETESDGIQITAGDGSTLIANQAFRAFLSDGATSRTGTLEERLAAEPQAAEALYRLMRAVDKQQAHVEEFRVRWTASAARPTQWLRLSVTPVAASGQHERAPLSLWRLTDITLERAREQEVTHGLEAVLAHYDTMPVGYMSLTSDNRIEYLNTTLANWLGTSAGGLKTRLQLSDVAPSETVELFETARTAGDGKLIELDFDLAKEDGTWLPVRALMQAPSEGAVPVLILNRDAEGRSGTDETAAALRLSRFMQAAPIGLATLDRDGKIVSSNAALARMLDAPSNLAGRPAIDLLPTGCSDEQRSELVKALKRGVEGRSSVQPVDLTFGPEGQEARRVYVRTIANAESAGEIAALYMIDATEQKALEQKFAQSHKMEAVGKLAGGIAHDFNNVLTAIIGFSDLLLQTHRPTDAAYKDIMNIKQNANRAAGLVRQLLAFSRRQTLQPEVLQLGDVMTDLSLFLTRLIGEQVDLKIQPGRDLWLVKADRTQFDQVMMNLAVNAKDAMPGGGRLTVRTRNVTERDSLRLAEQGVAPGEYVLIEVEDTGTGMPPEVMSKIFEPFYSTKEVGKGTGLGLSTVYGIIKQTGGYIFPESIEGKGTIFRVYLPRHVPSENDQPANRGAKKDKARDLTGSGCVLLVEDEDAVRSFSVRALTRQGYKVLEASTGVEALEVMAEHDGKIDIVVSDVVMPEMDGPTMMKEMLKTDPNLKIIFASGYPDDAFKKNLGENAVFDFLQKPFTLPQLAEKVKEVLAR